MMLYLSVLVGLFRALRVKPARCADGLQVDYFISHHWAEDFGEFVQSVLMLGMTYGHKIAATPLYKGPSTLNQRLYPKLLQVLVSDID